MGILRAGNAPGWRKAACGGAMALALAGCEDMGGMFAGKSEPASVSGDASSVRLVERDVEAPNVFQVTDKGLWDGRPSLGGVWVAHPDVKEPERVIIRNTANSKFVIGALFRRERANPGPAFQVSSDAAAALGMLAGAPAQLNVTALRREEAPVADVSEEAALDDGTQTLAPGTVETSSLDPVAGAAAAIDEADEVRPQAAAAPGASEAAPQPARVASAPASSDLSRPFIQIGIFSVEQNAENTATAMRQAGMVPTVRKEGSQGKTFWRVIVGPAQTEAERAALLTKIKGVGFDDAYAVSN
ncbi:Sporulation related domain-containing protein [Roseovarius nanhaiticus]|uniref:Sporulation related domain-containing protein n=1 Tax=Roseovarius nanhaiticus TaxID=573024 RepID=A0A1N7G489_9RHOB|nr:Sporulation related domain-containing protein [Roseovarius nanhaiticus]SIS07266.1 Sporulation related domain-containing protein [Roseovarius nanhaiticus]